MAIDQPEIHVCDWQHEYRGTHVAYANGAEIAAVQQAGVQRWRYRTGRGDGVSEWSDYFPSAVAAKRAAETAVSKGEILL